MVRVSYQVFARKYRPRTFDDVLGQEHVVQTLKNAIQQRRLAHAYLFVGPRGTGKTSTARIFAKALNCPGGPNIDFDPDDPACVEIAEGRSLDVLEIDGASNNSVEQVRDLRDNVQFAPASGQFKIYYIDEVHMLSKQAFNALLKTLEEPPPHVKFIFATTEAHKILPTILSRCQRFDLRPIGVETIARHLLHIASIEGINLTEEAAFAVAKAADGGMRDAQSMLDQLVSFCGTEINEQHVRDIFGITSRETVGDAISHLLAREIALLLQAIHEQAESGRDLMQFLGEMIFGLREVLVSKVDPAVKLESISPKLVGAIEQSTSRLDISKLLRLIEILAETENRMKWATNKRLHLEIGVIKAVHSLSEANISDIVRALDGAPLVEIKTPDIPLPSNTATESIEPSEKSSTLKTAEPEPIRNAQAEVTIPVEEKSNNIQTIPALEEAPSTRIEEADSRPEIPKSKDNNPEIVVLEEAEKNLPPSISQINGDSFFDEISGGTTSPSPETPKLSFLDDQPVRPSEIDPENEETPASVDENTAPLFDALQESTPQAATDQQYQGPELWSAVLAYLAETAPLKHISIEHTLFIKQEGSHFSVGVHPNDMMARDVLISQEIREKIEHFLHERSGRHCILQVVATEEVPMPEEVELAPLPLPVPQPRPRETKPSDQELKQKEQAQRAEKEIAKAQAAEEFYNDPLIQEALEIFQAKIIS